MEYMLQPLDKRFWVGFGSISTLQPLGCYYGAPANGSRAQACDQRSYSLNCLKRVIEGIILKGML